MLEEQNRKEKQIQDVIDRAREEAEQRAFDKMTPAEQVQALESKQRDISQKFPGMNAEDRARATLEYQQLETKKQKINDGIKGETEAAREKNEGRVFDRKWDKATDEQKAGWLAEEMTAAKKALATETDPLKREEIKGRMLDLAERGDAVAKSQQGRRESLADQAAQAKDGLGKMGLAATAQADAGISQRFDWMAAVGQGRSPDEQIAANTEAMKNYLKAIAEAEGVQPG